MVISVLIALSPLVIYFAVLALNIELCLECSYVSWIQSVPLVNERVYFLSRIDLGAYVNTNFASAYFASYVSCLITSAILFVIVFLFRARIRFSPRHESDVVTTRQYLYGLMCVLGVAGMVLWAWHWLPDSYAQVFLDYFPPARGVFSFHREVSVLVSLLIAGAVVLPKIVVEMIWGVSKAWRRIF